MKLYLVLLLLLLAINSRSQIYKEKGEIKFEVIQYTSKTDSIKNTVRLILHGELWKVPSENGNQWIILENNWSVDWVYNPKDSKYENTGVFENDSLVFLHPPRSYQYTILEYCPFPQIQFPVDIGNFWEFDLTVGERWLQSIKRKVEGVTIVHSTYHIVGKIAWPCPSLHKIIECYEIQAHGRTKFGDTSLKAYFSPIYGFVYLDYNTLNNDRFVFTIQSITRTVLPFQPKTWF